MSRVRFDRVPRPLWRWGLWSFDRAWRVCLGPVEIVVVKR